MTLEADGATFVANPHNEPLAIRALLLGPRTDPDERVSRIRLLPRVFDGKG
jgi:hypothetical protein